MTHHAIVWVTKVVCLRKVLVYFSQLLICLLRPLKTSIKSSMTWEPVSPFYDIINRVMCVSLGHMAAQFSNFKATLGQHIVGSPDI